MGQKGDKAAFEAAAQNYKMKPRTYIPPRKASRSARAGTLSARQAWLQSIAKVYPGDPRVSTSHFFFKSNWAGKRARSAGKKEPAKRFSLVNLVSVSAWYAALLIGVLAAAYTYVTTIDFSYMAPRLEQYVKRETGLNIEVGGPIGFASPIFVPGLYAEDVTLAPKQSNDVAPVHVGRFEIRINPLLLFGFDGTLHIREIAVRDAEFTLAVGQRQASFVDFLDAARSLLATVPAYYGEPVVDRVRFRDGELVYEASASRPERRVPFEDLRLTGQGKDAGLEFVGRLGGEAYVLSGTLDSYLDVLNGGASTLNLTGALGTLFVSLSGDLVDLSTLNLDLTYKVLGPDLTPFANILGLTWVQPHHGLSLNGDLSGNLGEAFQSQLSGQVGRGALEGEVILDLRDSPILTAAFQSPEFDLTPFVPAERPEV